MSSSSASARGEWKPGGAIPNEVDLPRELGISSGTMRKALDILEAERAVTRQQGRGTYVTDQSSEARVPRFWRIGGVDGAAVVGDSKAIDIVEASANDEERRRLSLGPHDHVYRIQGIYLNRKLPFMVGGFAPCGLISWAAGEKGHPPSHCCPCPGTGNPTRQGRGTYLNSQRACIRGRNSPHRA